MVNKFEEQIIDEIAKKCSSEILKIFKELLPYIIIGYLKCGDLDSKK